MESETYFVQALLADYETRKQAKMELQQTALKTSTSWHGCGITRTAVYLVQREANKNRRWP